MHLVSESESQSSTSISSSLWQSLFLKWLSHVHKPGHLPQMMLHFACWVPDDCFVFAQNCFFFSAFICVFCRAASSSFCSQSFSCRKKHVLRVGSSRFWSYRWQRADISFWDGNHNLCKSRQWIKFLECSRSVLIHCQGCRIHINISFIRKKVAPPKDVSVTRLKCSNLETIVCTVCCSSCEIITSK